MSIFIRILVFLKFQESSDLGVVLSTISVQEFAVQQSSMLKPSNNLGLIKTYLFHDKTVQLLFSPLEGVVARVKTCQATVAVPSHDIVGVPKEILHDQKKLRKFFQQVPTTVNSTLDNEGQSSIIRVNFWQLKGGGNNPFKDAKNAYEEAETQANEKFFKDAIDKYTHAIECITKAKQAKYTGKEAIKLNEMLRDSYFSLAMCNEEMGLLIPALENFGSAKQFGKNATLQIIRVNLALAAQCKKKNNTPGQIQYLTAAQALGSQEAIKVLQALQQPPEVVVAVDPAELIKGTTSLSSVVIHSRERVLNSEATKILDRLYTPMKCVSDVGLMSAEDRGVDLFGKFDAFMQSNAKKVFVLLGEAGGGKSYFLQNIEKKLWEIFDPAAGLKSLIPIRIELSTITNPVTNVVSEYLSHQGYTVSQIQELKQNGKILLILDGYDEGKFQGAALSQNLYVTNKLDEWKGKVIISGRLNATKALEPLLGDHLTRFAPIDGESIRRDLVEEVMICPFFPSQIHEYIGKFVKNADIELQEKYPGWFRDTRQFEASIQDIPGLSALVQTPFILRAIIEALPRIDFNGRDSNISKFEVYRAFTESCFEREEVKLLKQGKMRPAEFDGVNLIQVANDFCQQIARKFLDRNITSVVFKPGVVEEQDEVKDEEAREVSQDGGANVQGEWDLYFGDDIEPQFLRWICSDVIRKTTIFDGGQYRDLYFFAHPELRDYFISLSN